MMQDLESRIRWESEHFYVFEVRKGFYELRKHGHVAATVVGHGSNLAQVIRTAQRLEKYPDNV